MSFKEITQILNAGGVIIFPTETLYGLGCDVTNPQALLKIYQIKGRRIGKSFPLLVKDLKMLSEYAIFNQAQKQKIVSAKRPTNFILKARNLSPLVTRKSTGLFRISKSSWVKKLFRYFDKPLVATSANLSKQPPLSDPRKYKEIFGEKANLTDAVIFTGINRRRKPSTIIDLTKRPFKVLRK